MKKIALLSPRLRRSYDETNESHSDCVPELLGQCCVLHARCAGQLGFPWRHRVVSKNIGHSLLKQSKAYVFCAPFSGYGFYG